MNTPDPEPLGKLTKEVTAVCLSQSLEFLFLVFLQLNYSILQATPAQCVKQHP